MSYNNYGSYNFNSSNNNNNKGGGMSFGTLVLAILAALVLFAVIG